jgi:hypothetical protein
MLTEGRMTFDDEDLKMFRKNGVKIDGSKSAPMRVSLNSAEPEAMLRIAKALEALSKKQSESPVVNVAAPNVTVQPPEVNMHHDSGKPILKWKFTIERGVHGQMSEIIATAIQ